MYKHMCLEKIKKLYTSSVNAMINCRLKIFMVSTLEIFTDNFPMSFGPLLIFKKCSARNHSIYLLEFWMSKRILMSYKLMLPN